MNRSTMSKVIESDMYFLENDPIYGEEKPYSMRFYPGDVCPQSNIKRSKQRVVFNDMRTQESKMQLDECGFEVLPMRSHMEYEDFGDRIKIENVYLKELAEAIKQRLGATYVHVIEHTVWTDYLFRYDVSLIAFRRSEDEMLPFPSRLGETTNSTNPQPWLMLVSTYNFDIGIILSS